MTRLSAILCGLLAAAPALAAPTILPVTEVAQEHDQWCWAGTSRSTLLHFGVDQEQCVIAEYTRTHTNATDVDLGATDCCADWQQGCNMWNYFWYFGGSIADILEHFGGLRNLTFDRALALDEITSALDGRRLVLLRWVWTSGSGHFLLIHGYDGSAVYTMDPWPGEGLKIAEYAWVYSGGNHSWATSLTTGLPAASCTTDGARCDDGDSCTSNDACASGACKGTPKVCGAPACQQSACEPSTGLCAAATYLAEGTSCDDGDPCTEQDACAHGACAGTPRECKPTECHTGGVCRASTGLCEPTPVADGTACAGGTCQAGECQPAPAQGCSCGAPGLDPLAALAWVALLVLRRRRAAGG